MKKKWLLGILLLLTLLSCQDVPAGYVGIKVFLLGTSKGVNQQELGVGRYWIGINEKLYLFPTFQQNYVWTKNKDEGSETDESLTFQTKEGLSCNADVGISYNIDPSKVSVIFQKYRKGVEEITDVYLRNMVRDSLNSVASNYDVESVYGSGKEKLLATVESIIKDKLAPQGIVIDKIYWINSIRLPDNVVKALNAKTEATQRAMMRENELREANAEAEKKIAQARGESESNIIRAKGEAEANKSKMLSITPQLLEYEKVMNERLAIKTWNGVAPVYTNGNIVPFTNVGK